MTNPQLKGEYPAITNIDSGDMDVSLTDKEAEILGELPNFSGLSRKERRIKFQEYLIVFETPCSKEFELKFSDFLSDVCFDVALKPLLKKQFLLVKKNEIVEFIKKFIVEKDFSFQKYLFVKKFLFERNLCLDFVFESIPNENFDKYFDSLSNEVLEELLGELGHQSKTGDLIKKLTLEITKLPSIVERVNSEESIFPTEEIFNHSTFPTQLGIVHPIPKLSQKYSTILELLYRQFLLYRNEAYFNVRMDIQDTVARMSPRYNPDHDKFDKTVFAGWAPNGTLINQVQLERVGPVRLTENIPSYVLMDINYTISQFPTEFKKEWDSIMVGDILFLLAIDMPPELQSRSVHEKDFYGNNIKEKLGIKNIRGCQVAALINEDGQIVSEHIGQLENRTIRVMLDPKQYQIDLVQAKDIYEMYGYFNVLIRRDPSQNEFKYLLETLRDSMQLTEPAPEWIQTALLGQEGGYDAHYTNIEEPTLKIDFGFTFYDWKHLNDSFPKQTITPTKGTKSMPPPYILEFDYNRKHKGLGKVMVKSSDGADDAKPLQERIRFSPQQVEAIRSGSSHGLTIISGAHGTGKTSVAVQAIQNIYRSNPTSVTVVIVKSDSARTKLVSKLVSSGINQRKIHTLDFIDRSPERVNSYFQWKQQLAAKAELLCSSIGQSPENVATCEQSLYFFESVVAPMYNDFKEKIKNVESKLVASIFPFSAYFKNSNNGGLFGDLTKEAIAQTADRYFDQIVELFNDLNSLRPLELLRQNSDQADYLLVRETRILVMTASVASIRRRELARLGFKYQFLIVDEAEQLLEIEVLGNILGTNLNSVLLVGDHRRIPPLVRNTVCANYGKLDKSLFCRLIENGFPMVELTDQFTSRPEIVDLYRFAYPNLTEGPSVALESWKFANAGFARTTQFINVLDYKGQSETEPHQGFFQNIGEAEFVIATFMLMKLLGYPTHSITILTPYRGQKELLIDVAQKRCSWNPIFGMPIIEVVQDYSFSQNEFVLLSLVRTKSPGIFTDVRQYATAMSTAKRGLYVFGRLSVYKDAPEIEIGFKVLAGSLSNGLEICEGESYGCTRLVKAKPKNTVAFGDCVLFGKYVNELAKNKLGVK